MLALKLVHINKWGLDICIYILAYVSWVFPLLTFFQDTVGLRTPEKGLIFYATVHADKGKPNVLLASSHLCN